jgi:sugar (pentulose or hexulose) kinase
VGLYALGHHGSLAEASERIVRIRRTFDPSPELSGLYGELFELYRSSYHGLKEVFAALARIPLEEDR